jgi:HPt (histidine-containing phosphotransfer) domain-containing protein
MAELKEKFIERTHGELRTVQGSLAALEAGDTSALHAIVQLAHRMTGTGATLGLEALSERAMEVERLGETVPAGTAPDAATLAQLRAAIDALGAELERTPRGS